MRTRALIARVPHSHRYTVTDEGLDTAKFLTCVHDRVLRSGLAELATPTPTRAGSERDRRVRGHRLPPSNRQPSPPQHNSRHERSRTDRITHT